jgi:porphobilinogen synthase
MRRMRAGEGRRRLARETHLLAADLVLPIAVMNGNGLRRPIPGSPCREVLSVDLAVAEARKALEAGIPAVWLSGVPDRRDALGTGAYDEKGPLARAVRTLKREFGEALAVIAEVCLCGYTDHGHCGLPDKGEIDNDGAMELLAKAAMVAARAGADVVAPVDMMDGRVGFIRDELDEAELESTAILAGSALYDSAFWGVEPSRGAEGGRGPDRTTYRIDPANAREALVEMLQDEEEGADLLLVAPAGACLDVLRMARDEFDTTLVGWQADGECGAILAAAEKGWLDRERAVLESLVAIRRAGADRIVTPFALEAAALLGGKR